MRAEIGSKFKKGRGRAALVAMGAVVVAAALAMTSAGSDRGRLGGTWVRVAMERRGRPVPAGSFPEARLSFRGDRYTIAVGGAAGGSYRSKYEVESGKTPGRIVLHAAGAAAAVRGIYRLEGDTLTLCVDRGREPAAFATRPGSTETLSVYERARPGPGSGARRR